MTADHVGIADDIHGVAGDIGLGCYRLPALIVDGGVTFQGSDLDLVFSLGEATLFKESFQQRQLRLCGCVH